MRLAKTSAMAGSALFDIQGSSLEPVEVSSREC